MKSYNEVANNVFIRRNEYESKRRHRQDIYRRVSSAVSAIAIVLGLMTSVGTCYVLAVNYGLIDDFLGVLQTTEIEYQVNENGEIIYPKPDWGITVSSADVTPTGLTLIFTQSGGSIPETLIIGPEYYLEVQTDTEWEVLKAKTGSNVWNYSVYYLPADDTTEFEIDWSNIYGELSPGTYRVCKSVWDHLPTEDGKCYTYTIEFTIK